MPRYSEERKQAEYERLAEEIKQLQQEASASPFT